MEWKTALIYTIVIIIIVVLIVLAVYYIQKSNVQKKDEIVTALSNNTDSIAGLNDTATKLKEAIAVETNPEAKVGLQTQLNEVNSELIAKHEEKIKLLEDAKTLQQEVKQSEVKMVTDAVKADNEVVNTATVSDATKTDAAAANAQTAAEKSETVATEIKESQVIVTDLNKAIEQSVTLPPPPPAPTVTTVTKPEVKITGINTSGPTTIVYPETQAVIRDTSPFTYKGHTLIMTSEVKMPYIKVYVKSISGRFEKYITIKPLVNGLGNHTLVGIQQIIDKFVEEIKNTFRSDVDKYYSPLIDKSIYTTPYRGVTMYIHRVKYVDSDNIEYKPDPLIDPGFVKKIPTSDASYIADGFKAEAEIKANVDKKLGVIMYYLKGNYIYSEPNKLISAVKYEKRPVKEIAPVNFLGKVYKNYQSELIGAAPGATYSTLQCLPGHDAVSLDAYIGDSIGETKLKCVDPKTKNVFTFVAGSDRSGKLVSIPLRNAIEFVSQGPNITRFNNYGGGLKTSFMPTGFRFDCPTGARVSGLDYIADSRIKAVGLRCSTA